MAILDTFKEQLYRSVPAEDTDLTSHVSSEVLEPRTDQKSHLHFVAPWIASTISLALVSGYLLFQQASTRSICLASSSPAFRTDLPDSHPYIVQEERVFTGGLLFNETLGMVYRDIDPSQPQYFGPPNPDIDRAWDDLLRGEFVRLTEEEAAPYTPKLNRDPLSNHYHFEPDMFHSLHCLNAIRMELDADYYSKHKSHHAQLEEDIKNSPIFPDNWNRIHIDHCLDQLRQAIQCHGDLSPVPLYHYNDEIIGLGVGQTHTCRRWEPMREWMDLRKERDHQSMKMNP
ncbi:hypothetical protein N7535_001337 [Penicillium sp. DV-2018c]|nr:hypothetical protein N7535_001337 [Penicillium sp. DV-2018c]